MARPFNPVESFIRERRNYWELGWAGAFAPGMQKNILYNLPEEVEDMQLKKVNEMKEELKKCFSLLYIIW